MIDGDASKRYHVVQEFNKGVYDYIIATDESGAAEYDAEEEEEEEVGCEPPSVPRTYYTNL